MASVIRGVDIEAPAETVWDAIRDFEHPHERLVPGLLTDARPDGVGVRLVTFSSGATARERLVGVSDDGRRLAYSVVESRLDFAHHQATLQVSSLGNRRSHVVWISDVLPDRLAVPVSALMDEGLRLMKATIERGS